MKLLHVFLSGCMVGCVSKGVNSPSNEGFDPFYKSSPVDCGQWSEADRVLKTKSVLFAGTPEDAWIANDVILRTGESSRFVGTFPWTTSIRASSLKERKAGASSQYLGTISWRQQILMAIYQPDLQQIELRDIQNNVVVKNLEMNAGNQALLGSLFISDDRWLWMTVQKEAENKDIQNNSFSLLRFDLNSATKDGKEKMKGQNVSLVTNYSRPPVVRLTAAGQVLTIQIPEDKAEKKTEVDKGFSITLFSDKNAGKPQFLDLKLSTQVESFSASPMRDNIVYLSYVDGDTLLGQAVLRVARISWQIDYARVDWQEEFNLKNLHASEPFWISAQSDIAYLSLPVWDVEHSRILMYRAQTDGAKSLGAYGEFPIGLRLLSATSQEKFGKVFGVVRYRNSEPVENQTPGENAGEAFQICDFSKVMHEN